MKKTYATLLILIVMLFVFTGSVSADNDNAVAEFLSSFNFINNTELDSMNEYITRGEFVKYVSRLIPGSENHTSDEQYFEDVPKTHECFENIMLLKELEYVNGVANQKFAPDALIETKHALDITCEVLGGKFLPDDAKKRLVPQLTKGILSEVYLTKENAFNIICNALFSETFAATYALEGTTYSAHSDELYMEANFGIDVAEGIITDNGLTSIYGESKLRKNQIMINNLRLENAYDKEDYLGYEVRAYYKKESQKSIVYYIEEISDVIAFDAKELDGFDNNTYTFFIENNKKKTYTLAGDYKLIYNKKAISNESSFTQKDFNNLMKPTNGEILLIDNNGDRRYDICRITSYETVVVSGFSSDTETVSNVLDKPKTISFKDCDEVKIIDINGAARNLLSLRKYDVLSVAKSIDNSYAEIIVSTTRIEGNVQAYSLKDTILLSVNDTEYAVMDESKSYFSKDILGNQATLLLNHEGYVVYDANISKGNGIYAYIIDVKPLDKGLQSNVAVAVYTEDNNYKELNLSKNVKIDGNPIKDLQGQYNAIVNAEYGIGYVAIIKLNAENEVVEIDFPALSTSAKDEEWQIVDGLHNVKDKFDATYMGIYKLAVGADTLGFFAPVGGQKERYFSGFARSFDAPYDAKRLITAYVNSKNDMQAAVVVLKSENNGIHDMSLSDSSRYFDDVIITDIRLVINNDGESCTKLEYTDGSGFYNVLYSDINPVCRWSGKKVQVGDLVKFATDRKTGMINPGQIVIMYSPASDDDKFSALYYDSGVHGNDGKGSLYNKVTDTEARLVYGWIYDKGEEYIRLAYKKNPALNEISFDDQYVFSLSSLKCIIYDPENIEKVRIGTHHDVTGHLNTGNGSRVVLRTYQGSWIYVIK